jgi:hypothetical protein
MEEWNYIPGYNKKYEVSTDGRVRVSDYRGTGKKRIRRLQNSNRGYKRVILTNGNIKKYELVHRLVAMAFIPNPENKETVNHKNEIKYDNRLINLEWMTQKENTNYGTGRYRAVAKTRNGILSKKVKQYTLDGKLVKIWPSAAEAGRNGYRQGCISNCCRGLYKKAHNHIWEYA